MARHNLIIVKGAGTWKKISLTKSTTCIICKAENSECILLFAFHKSTHEYKNVWYMYNVCCNHIIGDKNAFIDIDPSCGSKVKSGNGENVEV